MKWNKTMRGKFKYHWKTPEGIIERREFRKDKKLQSDIRYRINHKKSIKIRQNLWAKLKRRKRGLKYNKQGVQIRCKCGQLVNTPLHDGLYVYELNQLIDIHTLH